MAADEMVFLGFQQLLSLLVHALSGGCNDDKSFPPNFVKQNHLTKAKCKRKVFIPPSTIKRTNEAELLLINPTQLPPLLPPLFFEIKH